MTDPLAIVLSELAPVLESLGIRFAIVGSLASSARGVYRATADGNLLAYIRPQQAHQLADRLGRAWYADGDAIESAIRNRRSFNLIHIGTAYKVDIFPVSTEFHEVQMERGSLAPPFPTEPEVMMQVISAEDIILSKLQWYAAGGEVSEKQWQDIGGVIGIQRNLDMKYLETWASRLGISRLLARALDEGTRDS